MKRNLVFICLVLAFVTSGCTYTGAIRSNITPTTVTGKTFKGDVSILVSNDIKTAEVTTSVGAHTIKVSAGSALNAALMEAARAVFPKATPQSGSPAAGSYEVFIRANLQHIAANSALEQGFWTARSNITAQVSIVIEMLRSDGSVAYRQVVTGTGLESRPVATPDKVKEGVEIALERAIQQVADGITTAFVTGLSEAVK